MDIFESLQAMFAQGEPLPLKDSIDLGRNGPTSVWSSDKGFAGLSGLFSPAALGGLAGVLLSRRGGVAGFLKGALLAGGGTFLWEKYRDRVRDANAATPGYGRVATPDTRARRLIRAMVFAAKSDGLVDEVERSMLYAKLRELNFGDQGEELIREAMNDPLDPSLIVMGVKDPEEALQVFTLSASIVDLDEPKERSYLDALGSGLKIPADIRGEILAEVGRREEARA